MIETIYKVNQKLSIHIIDPYKETLTEKVFGEYFECID